MNNLKTYESFWKELLSRVKKKRDIEDIKNLINDSLIELSDNGFYLNIYKSDVSEVTVKFGKEKASRPWSVIAGQDREEYITNNGFRPCDVEDTLEFAISYLKDSKIKLISVKFESPPSSMVYADGPERINKIMSIEDFYLEGKLRFSY